jgi:hypothetical protein
LPSHAEAAARSQAPREERPYLEALGILGELLIVWVIYVEVGGTRKQHRVETILDLYDRYEDRKFVKAWEFFEHAEFASYKQYQDAFEGDKRIVADMHRRTIKRFLDGQALKGRFSGGR